MGNKVSSGQGMFRQEAMDYLGSRGYGEIILARPISYALLTALFAAFAVALVVFFCTFSYARKATVGGEVVPTDGVSRIMSSSSGVVTQVLVKEGSKVKAGDVIAVVTGERASATLGGTETAIADVLRQRRSSIELDMDRSKAQSTSRRDGLARRIGSLKAELERIEKQVTLQGRRAALSEQALQQTLDLQSSNFVSAAQVREKQGDVLDQQAKVSDLQRSKAASERDMLAAEGELKDVLIQGERDDGAAKRSLGTIDQEMAENEAKRAIKVTASQSGTVAAINVRQGQAVAAGQPMVALIPTDSRMAVELYVASKEAGFLHEGMEVQLRYAAFAFQKYGQFTGKIEEVSGTAMRREEIVLGGGNPVQMGASDGLYRVRVRLDKSSVRANGREEELKPGMVVEGSVVLDTRKLYEWVVEPIYAVAGKM